MASSSAPLNEELLCSICLDVFTDPVTTPCGHNFCRACLIKCWTITKYYRYCPICKDIFSKRLNLEINTTLREIVEYFKKLNQDKSKVFCVLCYGKKQKAVKSCLTCESSYCETHLEPHLRVPRLQKHKLINAVRNLEDYICEKHQTPLELFCRDDQTCVCLSCTEGEHRNHNTVPIVQENQLLQTHQMIQERMKKIQETQHSVEQRKTQASNDFLTSYQTVHISNWLIISLGVLLVAALFIIPVSVQYAVSGDYKWFSDDSSTWIIKELKRRNTELEQILHTEDNFLFLQMYSSLYSVSHAETSTDSDVDSHTLKRAQTLKILLNEKLRQIWLKWVQMYAVDVTLDPDTANPKLILSDDGKQVIHGGIEQYVPANPKRFEKNMCVLAIDRFSSGRFFYEVQVKEKTEWYLGLAIESMNRKKIIQLTPLNGFWIVALINGDQYIACESPRVSLSLRVKPEKVGVFVDYEEGLISFYDVDSGSHIYSFTGQTFTEELFPLFSPGHYNNGKNSNPLIITPVS